MSSGTLIQTLADLVRINSINPAYARGRPEADVQAYVHDFFRRCGIEAREQPVMPGRSNVIGILSGSSRRRLVFEAHSDTAGVEGMTVDPFQPDLRDGRMYGRGACDTKAGLAAMLHAIAALRRSGKSPRSEIWVVAAVDEEHSYRGVLKLREGLEAAGAVVAEPTEMRLIVASKGCVRWRTVVQGKSAHSSKPHLGINAISRMARIIALLDDSSKQLRSMSHPLVGSPTLNVGVITGGTQVNIVPNSCAIEVDRRLIPGELPDEVFAGYRTLIASLRERDPDLDVALEPPFVSDWPLETRVDCTLVEAASQVLGRHGLNDQPAGVDFGSDASKFAQCQIPSIILGPGSIDQAHTANEYVEIEQVEKAFLVYRDLMREFE